MLELDHHHRSSGISITPLIDVVFILLLFFMLSSTFSRTQQIEVRSATNSAATQQQLDESQRLLVQENGQILLNGVNYAPDSADLLEQLTLLAKQDSKLIIAGTAQVKVQTLIAWVDQIRSLGIEQINIGESVAQ